MIRPWLLAVLTAGTLASGCDQVIDSLVNAQNPHALTAKGGDRPTIELSWSAPTVDDEELDVDEYRIFREGQLIGTSRSTHYSDKVDEADYGRVFSYTVDATGYGSSNNASAWCIGASPLSWGTWSAPAESTTHTGWFKTLVVRDWTYEVPPGSGVTLEVAAWDDPGQTLGILGAGQKWNASQTGKIWLRVVPRSNGDATVWGRFR